MSNTPRQLECEEAIRLVLDYLDNELEHNDHTAMEAHLHTCRSCFTRMEFEKRLKGKLRKLDVVSAPDGLKNRIKKITDLY
ncbi:MAG: zf-HC2 domain-containing protein [Granulosicoccaceae bacterium]|jgi:anti-sigma factor (TIGR02949 family)